MTKNTTIEKGIYRHYKGKKYEVIGEAIHSETQELLVLYKMLYKTEQYDEHTLWVRPKSMFLEMIEIDGKEVQRFKKVCDTY